MRSSKIVLKIVRFMISLLCVVLIAVGLVCAGKWAYGFGYRVFTENPVQNAPGTDKSITISEDMSAKDMGNKLKEEGLIRDANLFVAQLKLSSYADKIKAGTYILNTSMTAKEMMQIMAAEEETTETSETE